MKKIIFTLMLSFFLLLGANAQYVVYDNVEDFENAKGSICEAATDGCNNYFMIDGKVMGGTRMFCEDHKVEWNCTKYKEDIVTIDSIDEAVFCTMDYSPVCGVDGKTYSNRCGAEEQAKVEVDYEGECNAPVFCSMDYSPVCGVDGKTYSNRCGAEEQAKIEVNYEGECKVKKVLGTNDEIFYKTIQNTLDTKIQSSINKTLYKYESKLSKTSDYKKDKINKTIIVKIEKLISDLLSKYPADIALPKNINDKYLTYSLLKFELMKLDF